MSEKTTITFVLDAPRAEQVATLARENNRSVSGELRALIVDGLRARDITPAPLDPDPAPEPPCPNS